MTDDSTLLRRYREAQDQDAFTEIVRRHLPLVYSAALRRTNGDTHLASDIAQIVFSSLAQEAKHLQRRATITGWLYVATRHAALNAIRTESRRRNREQQLMTDASLQPPNVDWEQLRPALDEAIDGLTPKDRDAILLRFFEQRTLSDIGRALSVTEDAARMRVDRALDRLRGRLGRMGITSTASALATALVNNVTATVPGGMASAIAANAVLPGAVTLVSTSLTTALYFMNASKIIWTSVAVLLLAVGTAVFEANQAHQSQTALTEIRVQRDELQSQLRHLEAEIGRSSPRSIAKQDSLAVESAPTRTPDAAPTIPPTATTPPISPNALQPANPLASLYALRGSPEAIEAWLKAERSALELQFAPLFQQLGLTDAQQQEFKRLLMDKFQTVADIMGAAQAQGLAMNDPAIRATFKDATDKAESGLQSLLGPNGYQQLRQFGLTLEIRDTVRQLASDLYQSSTPLDAPTAEKLVQLIAQNTKQASAGYKIDTTDWPTVLSASTTFLTPRQLTMLRAEADQVLFRKQLADLAKTSAKSAH